MKRNVQPRDFRVPPGKRVHLAKWPTRVKPVYGSKKEYEDMLAKQVEDLSSRSATELEHDLLWRTTRSLPERGRIGIFNRSYYEEVLIARVHPEILRSEGLPDEILLDEKENARLIVAEILLDAFDELKMTYPKPTAEHRRELQSIRKRLEEG